MDRMGHPPLPVRYSDAVIVGTFVGYHGFLSTDRTMIYTELYVNVENVLKDTSLRIHVGNLLTILKFGGAVRYKGKVLRFPPAGTALDPLEVKNRYLLFLTATPALEAYHEFDGWKLGKKHATPLGWGTLAMEKTDPKVFTYTHCSVGEFLKDVETVIQEALRGSGK